MNWGLKIALGIGGFIAIIMTMVVISMSQDIHLVSKTYYEEEIAYQGQIDKMQNAMELDNQPAIGFNKSGGGISISFPESDGREKIQGKIHLFRPSDGRLDQHLQLKLDNQGIHQIDSKKLVPGLWRVKMTWEKNGRDYFKEEKIYIH